MRTNAPEITNKFYSIQQFNARAHTYCINAYRILPVHTRCRRQVIIIIIVITMRDATCSPRVETRWCSQLRPIRNSLTTTTCKVTCGGIVLTICYYCSVLTQSFLFMSEIRRSAFKQITVCICMCVRVCVCVSREMMTIPKSGIVWNACKTLALQHQECSQKWWLCRLKRYFSSTQVYQLYYAMNNLQHGFIVFCVLVFECAYCTLMYTSVYLLLLV